MNKRQNTYNALLALVSNASAMHALAMALGPTSIGRLRCTSLLFARSPALANSALAAPLLQQQQQGSSSTNRVVQRDLARLLRHGVLKVLENMNRGPEIHKSKLDHVQWLLAWGANPNHKQAALVQFDLPLRISFVLRDRDDDGTERSMPLTCASAAGDIELVRVLIRAGANVNMGPFGNEPLWEACKGGHVEVVRLLLSHGAVMIKELLKHMAKRRGHIKVVQVLDEHA